MPGLVKNRVSKSAHGAWKVNVCSTDEEDHEKNEPGKTLRTSVVFGISSFPNFVIVFVVRTTNVEFARALRGFLRRLLQSCESP